jgi:cytochrome P450
MGDTVLKMLSHITTPLFVGPPLHDDPEFLHLNCVFVGEVFLTAILMRQFPSFMHPLITRCLPSYWRLLRMKQKIANYLVPVIQERQRSQRANPNVEKRKDVLQYMIDMAQTEKEADPTNMAVRYIFTIIGSVHSVVAAATDTIYELIERPEYIQPLLEEVDQALKETGGEWGKDFASRLMKMDSFMKETMRVKPTTPSKFYRYF